MDEVGPGHAGLVGDVADPAVLEAAFRTAATAGGGLSRHPGAQRRRRRGRPRLPGRDGTDPRRQPARRLPRRQGGLPPSAARIEHRHGLLDLRLPGLRRPRRPTVPRSRASTAWCGRWPSSGPRSASASTRWPREPWPRRCSSPWSPAAGSPTTATSPESPWAASPTPPRSPTRSSTSPRRGPATSPASSSPSTAGGRSADFPRRSAHQTAHTKERGSQSW